MTKLELDLEAAREQINTLTKDLSISQTRALSLELELSSINTTLQAVNAEKLKLSDQYTALCMKDGKQRAEVDDLLVQCKRLINEKHQQAEDYRQMSSKLSDSQKAYCQCSQEANDLRSDIDRLKVTRDRYLDEKRELVIRLEETKSLHAKCEAESASTALKLDAHEKELDHVKKERDSIFMEHSSCREQICGLKNSNTQFVKDMAAKSLSYDKLAIEYDLLMEQKVVLDDTLQKIRRVQPGYDSPGKNLLLSRFFSGSNFHF